jgi:hypothetical protein
MAELMEARGKTVKKQGISGVRGQRVAGRLPAALGSVRVAQKRVINPLLARWRNDHDAALPRMARWRAGSIIAAVDAGIARSQ